MSQIETAVKKSDTDNLHQVSPEELTLVYNLRKMMMNDWVSSVCTFGICYSQQLKLHADKRRATDLTSRGSFSEGEMSAVRLVGVCLPSVFLTSPEENKNRSNT